MDALLKKVIDEVSAAVTEENFDEVMLFMKQYIQKIFDKVNLETKNSDKGLVKCYVSVIFSGDVLNDIAPDQLDTLVEMKHLLETEESETGSVANSDIDIDQESIIDQIMQDLMSKIKSNENFKNKD